MSNLFKSEADRNLWLKLNAEHQIEWERNLTWLNPATGKHEPTQQALNPRSIESALEIAKNQLKCDEEAGKLRCTLEEYLTLSHEQVSQIEQKGLREMFDKLDRL